MILTCLSSDGCRRSSLAVRAVGALIVVASGCTDHGGGPQLGQVEGTVTLDGAPLADAGVVFIIGGARSSVGQTDAQGHYELQYLRDLPGAVVGTHAVSIIRISGSENKQADPLPAIYNLQSTLTAKVKPGRNTFDFQLSSSPSD